MPTYGAEFVRARRTYRKFHRKYQAAGKRLAFRANIESGINESVLQVKLAAAPHSDAIGRKWDSSTKLNAVEFYTLKLEVETLTQDDDVLSAVLMCQYGQNTAIETLTRTAIDDLVEDISRVHRAMIDSSRADSRRVKKRKRREAEESSLSSISALHLLSLDENLFPADLALLARNAVSPEISVGDA